MIWSSRNLPGLNLKLPFDRESEGRRRKRWGRGIIKIPKTKPIRTRGDKKRVRCWFSAFHTRDGTKTISQSFNSTKNSMPSLTLAHLKIGLRRRRNRSKPRFYFITELEDFSAYEVNPHGLVNNSFCCFAFFHRRLNNIPKRKGRRQAGQKRNRSDAQ